MIPLSILDLTLVIEGGTARDALSDSRHLAQHAERWGFKRYWLAEHHNFPAIASAATALAIGYVAEVTSTIRVGAGGIMLPNHAPLVIAEQFGTLESLYPGRIDLGLGRAPGTDQKTAQALRRNLAGDIDRFPQDVLELIGYFAPAQPGHAVRAVPGTGLQIPVWILGSSLYGAQLAAALGLPYAFAAHFAPADMMEAIALYRSRFRPSEHLAEPYVMLSVALCAAASDEEAKFLFSSQQQFFLSVRQGRTGLLPPPVAGFEAQLPDAHRAALAQNLAAAVVGSPATLRAGLDRLIERTGANEIIAAAHIFDRAARLRSFEIVAEVSGLRR